MKYHHRWGSTATLFRASEVPFLVPPRWPKLRLFSNFGGYQKLHLRCPKRKKETTFIDLITPLNLRKITFATRFVQSKAVFWPFYILHVLECKKAIFFKWPAQDRLWVYNSGIFLWAPLTQLHHISRNGDDTKKSCFAEHPNVDGSPVFSFHANGVHRY